MLDSGESDEGDEDEKRTTQGDVDESEDECDLIMGRREVGCDISAKIRVMGDFL